MISSISTSFWLLESRDSTWLIFSGSAAGRLELARTIAVVWSGASPPARGWAIGLKTLRRTPLRSIARITPRLTLVRPTLVPVGISIIIRDTVYPLLVTAAVGGVQNSTASKAGGVVLGSQTVCVLCDDQLFIGWDN